MYKRLFLFFCPIIMKNLWTIILFSLTLSGCIPSQIQNKIETNPTSIINPENNIVSWTKSERKTEIHYNNSKNKKTDISTVKNHLTENNREKTTDFFYLSQPSISGLECVSSNSSLLNTICFSKWWTPTTSLKFTWDTINTLWYSDGVWDIYYQLKTLKLWELYFSLDEELINARNNPDYYPEEHMFWNNNRQQKGYLGESEKREYYITQKYSAPNNHYVLLQRELKDKNYEILKNKKIYFIISDKEIKEHKGGVDSSMKLISEGELAIPQIYRKDNLLYLFWIDTAVKIPVDWSSLTYEERKNKLYDKNYYYQAIYHTDKWHYEFRRIPK